MFGLSQMQVMVAGVPVFGVGIAALLWLVDKWSPLDDTSLDGSEDPAYAD
jgi:hypothetical protein